MARKTDFTKFDKVETTLRKGTGLNGTLRFTKPLKICGRFEGEIESDTTLYIDKGAEVTAEIKAATVLVSGLVKGNISASNKIEILPGGKVLGNLKASKVKIADGTEFEGRCLMIRDPGTIDIFSAKVEKLKEIVQSI